MPIYVVLGNFTQKRIETIKNLPEGLKESKKVFESFGVKMKTLTGFTPDKMVELVKAI